MNRLAQGAGQMNSCIVNRDDDIAGIYQSGKPIEILEIIDILTSQNADAEFYSQVVDLFLRVAVLQADKPEIGRCQAGHESFKLQIPGRKILIGGAPTDAAKS